MPVTIRDVARAAGVSKTTAAYILSETPHFSAGEGTRARVLDAARTLGYRRNAIAAALTQKRTDTFGVFLPERMAHPEDGRHMIYHKDALTAITAAAARRGLRIMPLLVTPERTLSEKEIADARLDGLIVTYRASDETFAVIARAGLPFVRFGSGDGDGDGPHVQVDNAAGMRLAVGHLASLGHRRLLHVTVEGASAAARQRREAFAAACSRAPGVDHFDVATEGPAVAGVLARPAWERPTALIGHTDTVALNSLDAARTAGLRVPEDLSVVGFDNSAIATFARPKLTSVTNPLDVLADQSIALLLALRDGATDVAYPEPVAPELIVRASTGPAPGAALRAH